MYRNGLLYNPAGGPSARSSAVEFGRLVRIRESQKDTRITAYIIAIKDADHAIRMVQTQIAGSGSEVEDMGRVSGELLNMLGLSAGQFVRTDCSNAR